MKKLLLLLAILVFPAILFAKGAVIPYAAGWIGQKPTDAELSKMTHLMIFQVFPDANGNLPANLNSLPSWTAQAVGEARAKGVKTSVAIGGASGQLTPNFVGATNSANIDRLVTNIRNLVNQYGFDGVDIDWEFPNGGQQWRQCMDLIEKLKNAMPDKRISIAVGGDSPNPQYNNHFNLGDARTDVQTRIWKADAIHLMTYDMDGVSQPVRWESHSSVTGSKACIDAWAAFGQGKPGFNKEKLFMGAAFYPSNSTVGDNTTTVKQKVDYCYDNGYGGVIIWELSHDRVNSGNNSLLKAIWDANTAKGGYTGGGTPAVVNHTITMTHNGYGSVTSGGNPVNSGGNRQVQNGQNIGFTFAPQSGFSVTDIKVGGVNQTAANTYTFNNVTSSQTLDVTFSKRHDFPSTFNSTGYSKKSAEITANDDNYGRYVGNLVNNSSLEYMININGGAGRYKLSAQTATGDVNLRNLTVKIGNTTVGTIAIQGHTGGWFNFVAREIEFDVSATGNQTLTITSSGAINIKDITVTKMAENKHLITVTNNPYGTVTGGNVEVNNGANATLNFSASSGYQVTDVKVGGTSVTVSNSHTLTNVTSPQTVDVAFSKRFSVPGEFNATEYSKKSAEIRVENVENERAQRSIGYLVNNSQFEFMINAAEAGKYVIGVETAIGQNGTRELSLHSGANALGSISVPGGSDWFAFRSRGVVVDLAAGEQTLRFTANGAINIRNITIAKENEPGGGEEENPPVIINEEIDLVDGNWEWENIKDEEGLGSAVSHNLINGGGLNFDITIGLEDGENEKWTWSEIASVPGGNWTDVTGITVNYTSDKPLTLTLLDNFKLADAGRGYFVTLLAGTNVNRKIEINEFKHFEDDWETLSPPLTTEQLYAFKGVAISPAAQGDRAQGSFANLIVHGLFVEPEEELEENPTSIKRKAASKAITGVAIVNGNLNLSLPAGANNANIVLFDVRGRILFERNIAVSGNFANVALPKNISRNQVAILQIKANNGFNLTKKILIK